MAAAAASSPPSDVRFVVTGFGKFPGVPANPTEVLVNGLREDEEAAGKLASCEVLKVSARTVEDHLRVVHDTVLKDDDAAGGRRRVFVVVHFGVDVCAGGFKLERRAFNEADFRLPDEDGFQPRGEPVVPPSTSYDKGACLHTRLDVESVAERLRGDGFDCEVSHDAGRYVCNYTYFASLSLFQKRDCLYSLFVHVPSFHAVDAATQAKFASRLIHRLEEEASGVASPSS
ncbi:pyrrolidone-carboxylate peptidase [Chloropicon primus]|uniref:Pyroglutamyl-peptidase I n=1 Tax=Chloropicon primus TaxID=1764295 RepID=A0A5B8MI79_9CHLO|nr:pyrrolidone-carboxylate peptidase [Chloropicon primus]UPQ99397.1 pyrrolidone-carboxylate peptidase [Chloropicon primus]|eukprot:QDZ20186.1 pyrrolidone-carboxylate peptidase [Chloropicon primus]